MGGLGLGGTDWPEVTKEAVWSIPAIANTCRPAAVHTSLFTAGNGAHLHLKYRPEQQKHCFKIYPNHLMNFFACDVGSQLPVLKCKVFYLTSQRDFCEKEEMWVYMGLWQITSLVGNEDLKAHPDGSLKQMQMSQRNRAHICQGWEVTLNINRALSLLSND